MNTETFNKQTRRIIELYGATQIGMKLYCAWLRANKPADWFLGIAIRKDLPKV